VTRRRGDAGKEGGVTRRRGDAGKEGGVTRGRGDAGKMQVSVSPCRRVSVSRFPYLRVSVRLCGQAFVEIVELFHAGQAIFLAPLRHVILLIDLKLKTKFDADATSGYNCQVKEAERMDSRHDDEVATKRDLGLLKQELIERIDTNGTKIEANGEKIAANSRKIEANGEKIDANGKKIARLITKAVENHDAIDKTLTREEYKRDHNILLQGQDEMMVILLRLDQERAATNAPLDRLETGRN